MTKYEASLETFNQFPYRFRSRVFGKWDHEFFGNAPTEIDKTYDELDNYDGLSYTIKDINTVNITQWSKPTITDDGIVSGFNASTFGVYVFNIEDITRPFEIYLSFITAGSGSNQIVLSNQTTGASPIRSDSLKLKSWSSSVNGGTYTLTTNTLYDVKGVSDGTTWYLYGKLSTETEWTLSYSCNIGYMFVQGNNELIFGRNTSSYTSQYLNGQIYLNRSSIRVASPYFQDAWITVWNGITNQLHVYDFSETILPWKWGYSNKLLNSNYCLDVNNQSKTVYTSLINGTVNGGVATNTSFYMYNFGSNNYLQALSQWNHGSNPWKIHLKIITGEITNVDKYLFGQPSTNYSTPQLSITNKSLRIWISSNKSSWDIANAVTSNIELEPNTVYEVDLEYTGENYKLSVNGVVDLIISNSTSDYSGTYPIVLGYDKGNTAFNGSINLKDSYIEFNGVEVWRGLKKYVIPSINYNKTFGTVNNVYVVNGNEYLVAESNSQPLDKSATNPRFLGTIQ